MDIEDCAERGFCLRGVEGGGGPLGTGGEQGGKWINCTWPICRPAMASNVEYAPVAIASIPARRYVGYGSRL